MVRPTALERFFGLRINVCFFGHWLGTGHLHLRRLRAGEEHTDDESSDGEE
jgi:hypothetical protein